MLRDTATCEANHRRFITRVAESEKVWALRNLEGYAVCDSNDDPDRSVLLFWSDRAYAKRAVETEFPDFRPSTITLFDFIFRWLPGMSREGDLVATNWAGDLAGLEMDPLDVQEQLTDALSQERRAKYSARLRQAIAEEHNE